MKIYFLVLSLLFLASCGKRYAPVSHDKSIIPYTQEFLEAASDRGVASKLGNISLKFTDSKNRSVLGTCTIMYKMDWQMKKYEYGRKIEVDREHWENASDSQRMQLITHEMGHCSLNRDHRKGYITYRASASGTSGSNYLDLSV